MQKEKEKPTKQPAKKEPIDMTTDELLDYVVAPKVAGKLREFVRDRDDRPEPLDSDDLA